MIGESRGLVRVHLLMLRAQDDLLMVCGLLSVNSQRTTEVLGTRQRTRPFIHMRGLTGYCFISVI